jgi:Domain of unknown function (DUF1917)
MVKAEVATDWVSFPDDLISDDSSFVGDAETKASYQQRARSFNPRYFWEIHDWNLQCIIAQEKADLAEPSPPPKPLPHGTKRDAKAAQLKVEDAPKSKTVKLESSPTSKNHVRPAAPPKQEPFNPYADSPSAYQLNETIEDFIDRLRPSETTLAATGHPWIWIANPLSQRRELDSDVGGFKQSALPLLDALMRKRRDLEEKNPTKHPGSITRILNPDRDHLAADIVRLAKQKNVTCGKWMLFPLPHDVDAVWKQIAQGTLEGRLGCAAKVATDDGNDAKPERLICIYTEDFSDKDDIMRVLRELKRLGLVREGQDKFKGVIYYKCDAYTYLDITSDNEYKLKASMYNSRDMFAEMKRKK